MQLFSAAVYIEYIINIIFYWFNIIIILCIIQLKKQKNEIVRISSIWNSSNLWKKSFWFRNTYFKIDNRVSFIVCTAIMQFKFYLQQISIDSNVNSPNYEYLLNKNKRISEVKLILLIVWTRCDGQIEVLVLWMDISNYNSRSCSNY